MNENGLEMGNQFLKHVLDRKLLDVMFLLGSEVMGGGFDL